MKNNYNIRINKKVVELEKSIDAIESDVYDISLKVKKQSSYWLCHKCGCLNVSYEYDDEFTFDGRYVDDSGKLVKQYK